MKNKIRLIKIWMLTRLAYLRSRNRQVLQARINGFVKVNRHTNISKNVSFNGCKIYGEGKVNIGANFHSAKGLIMLTTYHNHNGEKIPYDETVIHKEINIGDNVWIGMNVTILGGVIIGEGAIIQAGSVVSKSLPPLAIAGGNPAIPFKFRNEERYFKLKSEGKFL